MPNRILRDWTDSKTMNTLSWQEEVLFTRLIMKADDFGNFYADALLLKSLLFPRKDGLRASDIDGWILNLESAHLVRRYPAKGETFLHIRNFNQRLRQKKRQFPEPPADIDSDMTVNCPPIVSDPSAEEKRREVEEKEKVYAHPLEKEIYPIEHCALIAMRDERFVSANKVTELHLKEFNKELERRGIYEKLPKDYKEHYASWSKKIKFEPKPDRYGPYLKSTAPGPGN